MPCGALDGDWPKDSVVTPLYVLCTGTSLVRVQYTIVLGRDSYLIDGSLPVTRQLSVDSVEQLKRCKEQKILVDNLAYGTRMKSNHDTTGPCWNAGVVPLVDQTYLNKTMKIIKGPGTRVRKWWVLLSSVEDSQEWDPFINWPVRGMVYLFGHLPTFSFSHTYHTSR